MSLTPEQEARRATGIGASEAAAALGLSQWQSQIGLFRKKRGELVDTADTLAMRFGHAAEPFILDEYERETGIRLTRSPDTLRNGILMCHLDGWAPGIAVVNAKTARSREAWGDESSDQVPFDYVVQEQVEMLLAGEKMAHLPVLFAGSEIEIFEVPFDPELAQMIQAGVAEFWQRVLDGNPPDPTTPAEVRLRWPSDTGRVIEADETIVAAVGLLAQAKAEKKEAEAREADMAAAVQRYMEDAATLTYQGRPLATWKQSKPTSFLDREALKAAHPAIVDKFTSTRPGNRPLLLKKG